MENQISQIPTAESPSITTMQVTDQIPKKNNFLVIFLSTLLFISVVIAGFFAYQTQKLAKELQVIKNKELVTPTPTSLVSVKPTADAAFEDINAVRALFESWYISLGHDPLKVIITEISPLGKYTDKYIVSYIPSSDYVGGGLFVLVGKQNNKWIIPKDGDENYCSWIKNSGLDEATMTFLGSACKF